MDRPFGESESEKVCDEHDDDTGHQVADELVGRLDEFQLRESGCGSCLFEKALLVELYDLSRNSIERVSITTEHFPALAIAKYESSHGGNYE